MEKNDRLWELLAKQGSGLLTTQEQAELQYLLATDSEALRRQQLLGQLLLKSGGTTHEEKERLLDGIMGRIVRETEEPPEHVPSERQWRSWVIGGIAGMLVVAGTWIFTLLRPKDHTDSNWYTITTPAGSITRLTLPDGTLVVLNAGSTLSYPTHFNGHQRELKLTGEGFFNVSQIAEQPFVIHTAALDVRVLGTTFNIKAYPGDQHTETALLSGKVVVIPAGKGVQPVTLRPHQKLLVSNPTVQGTVTKVKDSDEEVRIPVVLAPLSANQQDHMIPETAWMENRLVYNNEKFPLLIKRIERWYGITITCRNKALLAASFTGNVQQESLERLLKLLQQTQHFEYEIDGKQVFIY